MTAGAAVRGKRTREQLIRAAVALVSEVGWGNVSTRLVADRAGVPAGAVHYHFRSLTDLLIDATTPAFAQLVDEADAALGRARDVPEGVAWLVGAMSRYTDDPGELRLSSEVFLAATRHERLGAAISAMLARFRRIAADWLTRCGHGQDAETTAAVLAATLDGLMLHRAISAPIHPDALATTLRRILAKGKGAST